MTCPYVDKDGRAFMAAVGRSACRNIHRKFEPDTAGFS